jgi:hypothetical protein
MGAMRATRATAGTLALGASCAALLGGCGAATKTVTVASSPPAQQETSTSPAASSTTTTHPSTTPTSSTPTVTTPATGGGTVAPGPARKAPEPAFAEHESTGSGKGAGAAAGMVRAHGYTPNNTAEYHSGQTLRVLVGTRTGSGDGYGQQAFFFLDDHYIGTDTSEPSATVKVISQSDTQVTLAYPLYRSGDPLSSPSGGQATVTFQLNNGRLTPLGQIPPTRSARGLSRY